MSDNDRYTTPPPLWPTTDPMTPLLVDVHEVPLTSLFSPPPTGPRGTQTTTGAPTTEQVPTEQTATANNETPQVLQPNMSDMQQPHTWRGQRQPPVGARLQQILNYLTDEDKDRRRDWARELNEADNWVQDQLDARDENGLGDDTIALLHLAAAQIKTHRRNEAYHYRTFMPLGIPDPDDMPMYAPRLPYRPNLDPIEFGVSGPKARTTEILPSLPTVPRPWSAVNTLWGTELETTLGLTNDLRRAAITALAEAEDRLLRPVTGTPEEQTEENNFYLMDNLTYELSLAALGVEGWTEYTRAPDGTIINRRVSDIEIPTNGAGPPSAYAVERGARRAGLQQALRYFHSTENQVVADSGRMLVLPGGVRASAAQDLDEVRRKAGIGNSRPITLPQLPADQMKHVDGKTDPQGFVANMAQFWRNARAAQEPAQTAAMTKLFGKSVDGPMFPRVEDQWRPLPPENLFGPFAWTGLPAWAQLRQEKLRQMRGLKRLFDRERSIAPRKLLNDMQKAFDSGYRGAAPDSFVRLVPGRDVKPAGFTPSVIGIEDSTGLGSPNTFYLDKLEMEWIRFLLNNSMTKGMTVEALPRTVLFLVFAQRLDRIFNDPGDTLFSEVNTSVSIEDLIYHMEKMKGPVQKTTFYPYDVKMFLERLAHQGRCRYTEDWRTYGHVQRPLLDYFPEQLVIWQPRDNANADPDNFAEDSIPQTPRFTDRHTWLDIVNDPPGSALNADVRNYFLCLAYRWGQGIGKLSVVEDRWATMTPLPIPDNRRGQKALHSGYNAFVGPEQSALRQLKQLWRTTLNKADSEADVAHVEREIHSKIIGEVVRADNMLYPGRTTDYRDPLAPKTRGSIWDWARPAIRGEIKQFFHLNRWPVELQTIEAQSRIKNDVDVDPQQLWNPIVEDPTPWTYYRPKARPYGDDRVKFRTGHRLFPIGDTARQREVVKNQVMSMVGRAMGIVPAPDEGQGVIGNLMSRLGLSRKRARVVDNPDDDEDDENVAHRHKLPRMDSRLFPQRVDRVALVEQARMDHEDATRVTAVSADQVPGDAENVNHNNRTAPNPNEALFMEQNMPIAI